MDAITGPISNVATLGSGALRFLIDFYAKAGDGLILGYKVRSMKGWAGAKDANALVRAGETMSNNLAIIEATVKGDQVAVDNLIQAQSGQPKVTVNPAETTIKFDEASLQQLAAMTAQATVGAMKPLLLPAPAKRGRKRKAKP